MYYKNLFNKQNEILKRGNNKIRVYFNIIGFDITDY